MNKELFQTYVINLKTRKDRKKSILLQFNERDEFDVCLVEAHQHSVGAIGLWNTIKNILKNLVKEEQKFVILCEDDHQFTTAYSKEGLHNILEEARAINADVLSGGISGFTSAIQVSEHLYWVEKFSGLQFTVIFRKFFQAILNTDFGPTDAADYKLCSLTDNKFFIYPFISIQKDFGYSDATPKNNKAGIVEELFKQTDTKMQILKSVSTFYKNKSIIKHQKADILSEEEITIPTYVINLPERIERLKHIVHQFKGKSEFNVKIIEACKHEVGAVGLWLSIRKIIKVAIEKEEDVIIICEDDHEFTEYYSKQFLLRNIIEAHEQYADYLSGGTGGFESAILISDNRFWVNQCLSTQFIVVYKKFFKKILDEPYDKEVIADLLLSEMTANKMVLYPFISMQRDFGYSDVTPIHNAVKGLTTSLFEKSSQRLATIKRISEQYK